MKFNPRISFFISRLLVLSGVRGHFSLRGDLFPSCRQNNTIKLGFIAPVTGDEAIYGNSAKNGFELAVERYNSQGGILGKQIEAIVYDDKVEAVIGGILSPEALAIAPLSEKYNLPIIVPSAAFADITKEYNTVFRTATTSPLHGRALAQFAYDILSSRKASVSMMQRISMQQRLQKPLKILLREKAESM